MSDLKELKAQLKEVNQHNYKVLPEHERKNEIEKAINLEIQISEKKREIAYKFVKELQDQDMTAYEAISLLEKSQEIIRHARFSIN